MGLLWKSSEAVRVEFRRLLVIAEDDKIVGGSSQPLPLRQLISFRVSLAIGNPSDPSNVEMLSL